MLTYELYQTPKSNFQHLVESVVYRDPLFESWHRIGQRLNEKKLTQDEILDLFQRIEKGATAAGSNRTAAGRFKDWSTDTAGAIKKNVDEILKGVTKSAPVAALDVAYDKATDAIANAMGGRDGDKSKVMAAIKKYRLLAKEYPKTAGFAKAALVAVAGLATGGAGLPAIAGLTYALDSAIKGDKLSSVLGKGIGAAALGYVGQKAAGLLGGTAPGIDANAGGSGFSNYSGDASAGSIDAADQVYQGADTSTGTGGINPEDLRPDLYNPTATGVNTGEVNPDDLRPNLYNPTSPGDGGMYTTQRGDQLGYIAQSTGHSAQQILDANPGLEKIIGPDGKGLPVDYPLRIPPGGTPGTGNVWAGWKGGVVKESIADLRAAMNVAPMRWSAMVNRRRTYHRYPLQESRLAKRSQSVVFTTQGVIHVIEQVVQNHNLLVEYVEAGPGRDVLPNLYRPDMPGAPQPTSAKPGLVGRGLNWLDRAGKKIGSGLRSFGHQLTTKVTADKLKMNWHQDGKPSDSDQLARWLVSQGVSDAVVQDVYSQLGISHPEVGEPAATPADNRASGDLTMTIPGAGGSLGAAGTTDATGKSTTPTTTASAAAGSTGSSRLVPAWDREKGRLMTQAELDKKYSATLGGGSITGTQPPKKASATKPASGDLTMTIPGAGGNLGAAGATDATGKSTTGAKPTWTGRAPSTSATTPTTASIPKSALVANPEGQHRPNVIDWMIASKAKKQPATESLVWSRNFDPSRSLLRNLRT